MAGTLASDEHRVTIDSRVVGGFVGNPAPRGIELESVGGAATLDGERTPSLITVVAERD